MDDQTHVRWLGHATVLIHQADTWILTDPVLRRRVAHLWRPSPLLDEDWPERVDAILISHLHLDHLDLPTLRQLGHDKLLLVPAGAGQWLERRGFRNVTELSVGDQARVEDTRIEAVQALHSGWRPPFGPTADAVGFVIDGKHKIYFPGDTDLFRAMSTFESDLDVALIPIWGWGSSLGKGHLDPFRAAEAVLRLQPRIAIPIHWGTFHSIGATLRRSGFLVDPPEVFARAAEQLVPATEVRILNPGEATVIE